MHVTITIIIHNTTNIAFAYDPEYYSVHLLALITRDTMILV